MVLSINNHTQIINPFSYRMGVGVTEPPCDLGPENMPISINNITQIMNPFLHMEASHNFPLYTISYDSFADIQK